MSHTMPTWTVYELYPYLFIFGMEKLRVPCHAAMPPYCHAAMPSSDIFPHIPTFQPVHTPIQAIPPLHLAGVLRSSPPAAPPGRCWPAVTGRSRSPKPRGGATLSPPPKKCHAPPGDEIGGEEWVMDGWWWVWVMALLAHWKCSILNVWSMVWDILSIQSAGSVKLGVWGLGVRETEMGRTWKNHLHTHTQLFQNRDFHWKECIRGFVVLLKNDLNNLDCKHVP